MGIIYSCLNTINNKKYIGMSIRDLSIRKQEHLKELRNGIKGGIWQKDFEEYGENAFVFTILEEAEDSCLPMIELAYIGKLNTMEPNGYNRKLSYRTQFSPEDLSNASKHDIAALLEALRLGLYTQDSIPIICNKTKLTKNTVSDLLNCKSYKWVKHYSEQDYLILERIISSNIRRSSLALLPKLSIAIDIILAEPYNLVVVANKSGLELSQVESLLRKRAYLWLSKIMPDKYTKVLEIYNNRKQTRNSTKSIIDLGTGEVYTGNSVQELSNLLKIDHRRVSDIISGKLEVYQNKYMLYV